MSAPDRRWGSLPALAVALLWFFPYHAHLNNPNENVRVYATRAVVEHGTLAIGRRRIVGGSKRDSGSVVGEWGWVNDKALVCDDPDAKPPTCAGSLYAAKAPGLSLLAVPAYAVLSAAHHALRGRAPGKTLTVRWLRLLTVTIPWLAFLVLLRLWLRRRAGISPLVAELTVLALGAGSITTAYALVFTGHALAALTLGGALLLLERHPGRFGPAAAAGLLCGLAVASEYPTAPVAVVLAGFGLLRAPAGRRMRVLAGLTAGAMPMAVALGAFHTVVFGHPLATPYAALENAAFVRDSAPGVHGIALPSLHGVGVGLFAPHAGLLFHMPLAALALPGAVTLLRREAGAGAGRALGGALLAATLVFLTLLVSMPNLRRMLGWTVGPRYIAAAGPVLVVAAAFALERLVRRWPLWGGAGASALVLVGVVLCGLPALVYPHYPPAFRNPAFQLMLPLLVEGYLPRSLGTLLGATGWLSALPGFAALALAAGAALRAPAVVADTGDAAGGHEASPMLGCCVARAALAVALACVLLGALSLPGRSMREREVREAAWVRRHWEPGSPAAASNAERVRRAAREGRRKQAARTLGAARLQVPKVSGESAPPKAPPPGGRVGPGIRPQPNGRSRSPEAPSGG